jgi:hypothetical protein
MFIVKKLSNKKKIYLNFEPAMGYPVSKSIFYECGLCGDYIPSQPDRSVRCKCRNIVIDADAGRVSVKNEEQFKVFKFK